MNALGLLERVTRRDRGTWKGTRLELLEEQWLARFQALPPRTSGISRAT
jgi:hypothetical protein